MDGELTGRSHDDGIDLLRVALATAQSVDDGQEIGRGLTCTRLGTSDHVAAFEEKGDGGLLYGCGLEEVHRFEPIQHFVLKI